MNIKVTGVVKYKKEWKRPGDELTDVPDEVGKDLVDKGLAVVSPKTQSEIDAELKAVDELEQTRLAEEKSKAEAKELADKEEEERIATEAKRLLAEEKEKHDATPSAKSEVARKAKEEPKE